MSATTWIVGFTLEVTAVLAVSWLVAATLRRDAMAARRHGTWTLGIALALVVPLMGLALPRIPIATPDMRGLPSWLPIGWALGVLAVTARLLATRVAVRRLERRAVPLDDGDWYMLLDTARSRMGVRRPVRLLFGAPGDHPVTWGWREPRVVLPRGALAWSPERVRMVLDHELAHVARGDHARQALSLWLAALQWFNPLAWIAVRRLAIEREIACDLAVVAAGTRPSAYARLLVQEARERHGRRPAALPAFGGGTILERRVRAILDPSAGEAVRARGCGAGPAFVMSAGAVVIAALQSGLPDTPAGAEHLGRAAVSAVTPEHARAEPAAPPEGVMEPHAAPPPEVRATPPPRLANLVAALRERLERDGRRVIIRTWTVHGPAADGASDR